MFYVSDITSGTGNIIAHQYYFDTDPGVGVAGNGAVTPIASTADYIATLAITVPALGNGIHQLYLRTQDEFGHWSIAERRMFYVTQITEGTRNIVTYQYFFDSDPGVGVQGNGAVLSVASTADFSSTVAIAMPALSGGLHQLYFRTKDDLGRWSIAERRMFYLNGASYSSPTVSALEYYYDMDPGVGNGNPVSIAATADIDSNFLFGVPCLSSGTHYLYVRAKDEQGNWSIIERDTLQITSGIEPAVVIPSGPINLCAGEEITLSTTPVPSVTYQWVESGDPISGETDPSIVITTAGNYALRSYCGSAFIVSNTVIVTDLPLVTFYADSDEDGYGDANVVIQDCSQPTGCVSNNDDCNDADMSIHPGASEICNLIDDNCNGTIDEGGQNLFFADTDNDSFGNPDVTQLACFQPAGFVTNDEDCNDSNNAVHPNAIELCNGLDDNCDGLIDADDPTVIDTEAPTITCLNEISVNNDAGACQANVTIPPPAVTDDCIGASTALRFDGSFQFVDPQTFTSVSNNFTIEMWVNPTAVHEIDGQTTGSVDGVSGQRYALWPTHGFGWNGVDAGAGISVGTNGISVYEHADSYMPPILVYEAPITGWTHLSVVYVNKQPSLYVNGALVATGLVSPRPNIHPSAGNGWSYPGQSGGIGGGSYGNFMGDIDEVRIWNYSRSQSEIQGDFLTHLTGMESGLFLYYDFEDGTGSTTAQDASTSNLNGILNNMDPATDWIQPGSPVSSSVTLQNDFNDSSNASGLYPLGTTLVTWTATDAAGNSATCSFNVIVHDTEAPVFSECPTGIEDEAEEGQWGAHVSWTEPAATDNCEMQSTSATHAPGDFFNVGSTEVSYTALDIHGNSSTCSFTVEVSPPDILGSVNLSIFANDIQFSNSNPAPGTFINVSATVHNNSNVAAASFVCHLLNQYDNTTYPDIIVPALAANQSTVVTWNIQTPADPAFVPMQVTIDYLNNVTESNELDNQAIRPFVNGSLPFSGHIVVVANAIPYSAIAGSGISICGNAYYDDTAIPLIDSSVAGAQVTVTIAETGQVLYGVTNSNGYFCIGYSTPNTAGLYHFIAAVTDFTLTGDTTGTFQLVPPPVDYCPTDLSIGLELYGSFLCGNAYHIVQGSSLTGIVNIYNGCHSVSTPTTLFIALPDGTPVPGPYIIPSLAPGEAYSLLLPEMTFNTVGSTYISATVDFFNGVAEDNESNNSRSIPIQVHPPLPDITPTQGWVSTDYQCETASVSFRIDNTGGIPTGGFNTVLEIYQGSTLETSFTQTVSSIPALCYTYVTFVFDPQFSGEYHFNLYCDTMPSVVTELSDVNNSLSMTHFFQPCNFDLLVHGCGSMDVKPTNPVSPGSITLYATIGNYGQLPVTTPFVVNFIAGETTYPVPVTQTIPANSSVNVSVTIPTPAFGNNDLTVEVDANHEVTELNESNNTNSAKLCWDFVLTNTSCSGGSPLHGTQFICNPIQLAIGLYNLGLYEASNLKVKFEVSGPGISGWSNLGFATVFVDNTCGCPQIVNLPSSFLFPQTGFYDVRITADFQNLYTECFEDNNQLVLPVQVVENADYSVYSQFIAPSELNPDINEPVTFNLTYKNEGCTGLSPVELYMQMDNTPHDSVSAIALASNALNTYSMSQPWSSALPGVHVIRAVIDHDQALVEGNELNNEATRSIIVGGAPNFNLFALGSSNMSPLQGETVSLTCSIINEGQNIADGTLQFYFN